MKYLFCLKFIHINGTKISIYRKNLEHIDSPLEMKLVDSSGRMTSIFNYNDCIEQLNVPLDTKQMLQKTIKVYFEYYYLNLVLVLVSRMLFDEESIT
jgi:hypothetical protein